MNANIGIRFGLHDQHCANLSEDTWLKKLSARYLLPSVGVRLGIFSQLSMIQYMGLCVFNLAISFVMIKMIYTLSYYHHQNKVWTIIHSLGLGHETIVCAVCLSLFLIKGDRGIQFALELGRERRKILYTHPPSSIVSGGYWCRYFDSSCRFVLQSFDKTLPIINHEWSAIQGCEVPVKLSFIFLTRFS